MHVLRNTLWMETIEKFALLTVSWLVPMLFAALVLPVACARKKADKPKSEAPKPSEGVVNTLDEAKKDGKDVKQNSPEKRPKMEVTQRVSICISADSVASGMKPSSNHHSSKMPKNLLENEVDRTQEASTARTEPAAPLKSAKTQSETKKSLRKAKNVAQNVSKITPTPPSAAASPAKAPPSSSGERLSRTQTASTKEDTSNENNVGENKSAKPDNVAVK